jgi:hypothetical protein
MNDIATALAIEAYQRSRFARKVLRIFFLLPMSIIGGALIPMCNWKVEEWSLMLFAPFMIGAPVLLFFFLGEHPDDREFRRQQIEREMLNQHVAEFTESAMQKLNEYDNFVDNSEPQYVQQSQQNQKRKKKRNKNKQQPNNR